MKLPLYPILLLAFIPGGCANDEAAKPMPVAVQPMPVGAPVDPNADTAVRNDEVVKTYPVGPYVDDANVRHDAHDVERVEQSPTWNLAPNTPTAINMGPAVAVADPNAEKQALNGELAEQMVKEQALLKVTAAQNDAMAQEIANLKARIQTSDADKQSAADLKAQIEKLQKQIDDLKNKQTSTAPDKPAVADAPHTRTWREWWAGKSPSPTPSYMTSGTTTALVLTPAPTKTPDPNTSDMSGATFTSVPVQTLPPVTTATNPQENNQ